MRKALRLSMRIKRKGGKEARSNVDDFTKLDIR